MDDSQAGRKLCHVSRQLGRMVNRPLAALTHQNPGAGGSTGGHCSYLPTTREQRKLVSGVVASMNAPHYSETKEMTERDPIQLREERANRYANQEDFHTIFSEHLSELYQLSFLLTRDAAKAERCLVSGLEDCVTGNHAFREWARSWAKRTIVQNAIRELKPRPSHSNSPLSGAIFPDIDQFSSGPGGHFAMDAVLGLEDFERFVFVMSVLEHYSEHDCGLLLGCSAREVREARGRALEELMDSSQRDLLQNQPFMQEKQ
jgi:DNA-directed RNA polymerase specialized sigma24 family protein